MSWNVDPDRAWLGVLTLFAIVGSKRILDTMFPRGSRFKFMSRWLEYGSTPPPKPEPKQGRDPIPDDPDDPDIDKWMGAGG